MNGVIEFHVNDEKVICIVYNAMYLVIFELFVGRHSLAYIHLFSSSMEDSSEDESVIFIENENRKAECCCC